MAYDAASGDLLLFGGTGADGQLLGDTWEFNGSAWTQMNQGGMPALTGASMAYDAELGQVLLFGGLGSSGPQNETWIWNPLTGWTVPPNMTNTPPLARYDAALSDVESGSGSFVLFGGIEGGASPEGTGNSGSTTTATPPTSTATQSAAIPGVTLNDTWTWDGDNWTEQPANGPVGRAGASATWDPNLGEALLFGGSIDGTDNSGSLLNDLWAWDGSTWIQQTPAAPQPPSRTGATFTADPAAGGDVLLGGLDASGAAGGSWLFVNGTWKALSPANAPAPTGEATAAWVSGTSQLVYFGGTATNGATSAATWALVEVPKTNPTTTVTTPTTHPSPPTTTKGRSTAPRTTPTTRPHPVTTTVPTTPTLTTPRPTPPSIVSVGGSGFSPTTAAPLAPITASKASSHPGQQVLLSGGGYTPGARIAIWFHSNPVLLAYVIANSAGHFSLDVTIPANAAPGDHHFEAEGLYAGKLESFSTPVQITMPPPPGHSPTETLVLILVALLVPATTWVTMALYARRQQRMSAGA